METNGPVVIVGQGYVGLPVAMRAVAVGMKVVGLDLDRRRVSNLSEGRSYVEDISNQELQKALGSGRYLPSSSYDDAAGFRVAVITVPTPLKESIPDLSFIESAATSLAKHLALGATVILESTTYPGTTDELLVPILERESGLLAGRDFHVGYSPERIDPGNKTWGFVETPKVVSGIGRESLVEVQKFYDALVETTVPVSSPKEAELTKLLENTFRHVNIALVNELAVFANQLGVNIWESIEASATKPFGYMKFTPGPGVGGHCLPVDPSYLSWQVRRKLGQNFRFVELANDVNDHMPHYVIERVSEILNDTSLSVRGSKILLIGLSYKKNTGDVRQSPAMVVAELLRQRGAILSAVDPHVMDHEWPSGIQRVDALEEEALRDADLVVLLNDHDRIDLSPLIPGTVKVFDTKNKMSGPNIIRL